MEAGPQRQTGAPSLLGAASLRFEPAYLVAVYFLYSPAMLAVRASPG